MQISFRKSTSCLRALTGPSSRLVRVLLCLTSLIFPVVLRAQQASEADELKELRQQLQAIAARIDAIEKQHSENARASNGGPNASLEPSASVSVPAQPQVTRQETVSTPAAKPTKAEPFAFA